MELLDKQVTFVQVTGITEKAVVTDLFSLTGIMDNIWLSGGRRRRVRGEWDLIGKPLPSSGPLGAPASSEELIHCGKIAP